MGARREVVTLCGGSSAMTYEESVRLNGGKAVEDDHVGLMIAGQNG